MESFNFKYFNSNGDICTFPINKNYKLYMCLKNMPDLDLDKFNSSVDLAIIKSTLDVNLKENQDYLKLLTTLGLIYDGLMWFE